MIRYTFRHLCAGFRMDVKCTPIRLLEASIAMCLAEALKGKKETPVEEHPLRGDTLFSVAFSNGRVLIRVSKKAYDYMLYMATECFMLRKLTVGYEVKAAGKGE